MEKVFDKFEKIRLNRKLKDLLCSLNSYLGEDDMKKDIETLLKETQAKDIEYDTKYRNVLEYISQFYGKFVHIKLFYNANYSETRETQPEWKCDYDANALLYSYNQTNNCLFGIFCKLGDRYCGGVKDECINLLDRLSDHKVLIEPITKETFIETAWNTMVGCLDYRLGRIESSDYTLTSDGYKKI